jgi:hypothetical protein
MLPFLSASWSLPTIVLLSRGILLFAAAQLSRTVLTLGHLVEVA